MYFNTTIKGGLPVVAYAERDPGYGWYVTDLCWRTRKGHMAGKSVPASVFNAVSANDAEMRRLNSEADAEYADNREYYNS